MKTVLITDIDNTLYDYVGFFGPSFSGMLERIEHKTGIAREDLYDQFRSVFEEIGTLDYQYLISKLDLAKNMTESEVEQIVRSARLSWDKSKANNLHPYPGVHETLEQLSSGGVAIVAVTNAPYYHAYRRLEKIGLFRLLDGFVAWEGNYPSDLGPSEARKFEKAVERINSQTVVNRIVEKEMLKPAANMFQIVKNHFGNDFNYFAVGDSIIKDLLPASECGMQTIWARYGAQVNREHLDVLLQITPWTSSEVKEHTNMTDYKPDTCIDEPGELLRIVPYSWQIGLFDD